MPRKRTTLEFNKPAYKFSILRTPLVFCDLGLAFSNKS